jgi:hypothetical protein
MADKQSRLAEIYKAEKSKGGGLASTLSKRALEKMDPRKFFNQKGFLAAALPSLFKSYSATPTKTGEKIASAGGGSFSSGVLETKMDILTGETRELKIHSKLAAKNSVVLPSMARDMNVMRQNIVKLVKLQGGTATTKADMFFKRAGDREAGYESRFSKAGGVATKTPTQVGAKPEEKKGIFATIMEGLSSIFSMKGALIAGILAVLTLGIKEYFSNDEFKAKVDALVSDMFSTIKGFLIEYWKEVAIGLALLFPSATMTLISSGISILSNGITLLSKAITTLAPLFAEGLTFAATRLITLLSGPAGLVVMLGLALFAARKLFDQNQEEYLKLAKEKKEKGSLSEKDEARLKQLNSPANEEAAEKQLGYNPITGKLVTQQQANRSMDQRRLDSDVSDGQLKKQAENELMDEAIKAGKDPSKVISNKDINTRFEKLKKQRNAMNSAPNESGAEAARLAGSGNKPTPAPYSSAADSQAANPTTPSNIPNIPGSSKETSKTPTIEKFDYTKYKELVGIREGGGKYDADNKVGFLGKYQFGAQALETFGYLKPGTSVDRNAVYSPSNWTGKNGMDSAEAFKKATDVQENLMNAYTDMNLKGLQKSGVLTGEDSGSSIAAKLYAAHHGGVGGASKFFKENKDTADFAFAGASVGKSAALMAKAYETGQIGGAEYSGLGGTQVASVKAPQTLGTASAAQTAPASSSGLKMPTMGTLAAAAPTMGDMIEAATSAFSDITRVFDTAMASVTNVTNNNTQSSAGGQQSQGALPSVYDDVFLSLFQRVT